MRTFAYVNSPTAQRHNHGVIKVPDDAFLNQGEAVNGKLVYCDLASLRWTRPGPAMCSAWSRSHSAIWRVSSTSLLRLSVAAAQPTTACARPYRSSTPRGSRCQSRFAAPTMFPHGDSQSYIMAAGHYNFARIALPRPAGPHRYRPHFRDMQGRKLVLRSCAVDPAGGCPVRPASPVSSRRSGECA
jgi:hypothetical protein